MAGNDGGWLQIAVAIVKANIWKAFENNVKRVTYTQCAIAARPRLPRWSDSHARLVVGTFRWYSHRGMVVFHVQGRSVSRPNIFTVLYSNCSWFLVTWLPPSNFNRHMCETDFFGFEFEEKKRKKKIQRKERKTTRVMLTCFFLLFFQSNCLRRMHENRVKNSSVSIIGDGNGDTYLPVTVPRRTYIIIVWTMDVNVNILYYNVLSRRPREFQRLSQPEHFRMSVCVCLCVLCLFLWICKLQAVMIR